MKNKLLLIALALFFMYLYLQYGSVSIQTGGMAESVLPNVLPNLHLSELLETSTILKQFQ
jgi:hypothetical protein